MTLFQPLHFSSDPLSPFWKVTLVTPPSAVDVMFVLPLYHSYFADGCLVSHLKYCFVPDITLIEEAEIGLESNITFFIGTEKLFVTLVN